MLDDFRHDLLHDVGIAVHQTQPRLARLLGHPSGDHHHVGLLTDLKGVTGHDGGVLMEGTAVLEIFRFTLQLFAVDVDHGQGSTNVLEANGHV